MQWLQHYLDRKHQEILLIGSVLARPGPLGRPGSVEEVVERKFRLGAALKSERALIDWAMTETRWSDARSMRIGPFTASYGYQRADLSVSGPPCYGALRTVPGRDVVRTIYTSAGMSAISVLLVALGRVCEAVRLAIVPGSYKETLEVAEAYVRNLSIETAQTASAASTAEHRVGHAMRVLLVDSCVPKDWFRAEALRAPESLDLIVFDTTCFSTDSGRIGRVLRWARRFGIPLVLIRSHTKLDSLGIEFGRLGSAVFVASAESVAARRLSWFRELVGEMQDAVRLFGAAAVPAHLCPFAGNETYRRLNMRRTAAMVRNGRRMARRLASRLGGRGCVTPYQHGLFLTLRSPAVWTEDEAKHMAADLAAEIGAKSLPLRHAGSFGFDFIAAEAFFDTGTGRHVLRISSSDLPPPICDRIAQGIEEWWRGRGLSERAPVAYGIHRDAGCRAA